MSKKNLTTNLKKYTDSYLTNHNSKHIYNLFLKNNKRCFSEGKKEETKATKEESKSIPPQFTNMKYIAKLSKWELKDLILDNKNDIKNNKFFIRSLPDPNKFGEALLFKSPLSLLHKYSKNSLEYSGYATISLVTVLNYFGLIFPSTYLFPYLALMSLTCLMKNYAKNNMGQYVYQITLLNEHQVRVTYVSGRSELVDIKNIYLSQDNVDVLLGSDNVPKNYTPEQIAKTPLVLSLRIGQNKTYMLIRQASLIDVNLQFLSFFEAKLLLGILDKDVKKLAVV